MTRAVEPADAGPASSFPDLAAMVRAAVPDFRGQMEPDARLAELTWFRVGGPAQLLVSPADAADLAYLRARLPADVPVTVLGLGSNLIVRDGGIPGVVVRLGKAFGAIAVEGMRVTAGAGAADVKVARLAGEAGVAGLAFLRGIPGAIGGAVRMNAGAYGGEVKDILIEAEAVTPAGDIVRLKVADLGFTYRHCALPEDWIFTQAVFEGRPGDPAVIAAEMDEITRSREATQPVKSRTGGSTFKNPPGTSAWKLVDEAGCRGLTMGRAQVSPLHTNFLINTGGATAAEIEALGEEVRRRVKAQSGVTLDWEIRRIGRPG